MSEPKDISRFKVIIIGGGIAGLATAYVLERAKREGKVSSNLQVSVYERNEQKLGYNGYPIQFNEDSRKTLKSILLPEAITKLIQQSTYGITHGGINILSPELPHLYSNKKYENEQPQWVNRQVLKDTLAQGVSVYEKKRVVKVEEVGDKVNVEFEDEGREVADLVVGADGLGSLIRSHFHPSFSHFPTLPYLHISFKLATPLTSLPTELHQDCSDLILGNHSDSIQIIPLSGEPLSCLLPPKSAIKLSEAGPFSEPSQSVIDIKQALNENSNLSFVLIRMIISTNNKELGIGQGWEDFTEYVWIEKILHILKKDGMNEKLVELIKNDLIPDSINAVNLISNKPAEGIPYKEGRVVLVGDAMHVAPSTCGAGAATALQDAQGLVETLLSSSELGGNAGQLSTLLPQNHYNSTTRFETNLKESIHLLEISVQSGFQGFIHRSKLKSMDLLKGIL